MEVHVYNRKNFQLFQLLHHPKFQLEKWYRYNNDTNSHTVIHYFSSFDFIFILATIEPETEEKKEFADSISSVFHHKW